MGGQKVMLYIAVLPRWFAAPIIVSAILLGYFVSTDTYSWTVLFPVLCGLFVMAWDHSMNTHLDYFWTKLDQGVQRSHPKPYTSGQQALATGRTTGTKVLLSASVWLLLSGVLAAYISFTYSWWAFIPWLVAALSTFWYSWAKLHWQPELALGISAGPMATLLGASITSSPHLTQVALAGLPILLIFGFAAEAYDQWYDGDTNVGKGLRNIGALTYMKGKSIALVVLGLIALTYIAQVFLIITGILAPLTLITLAAIPGLVPIKEAEKKNPYAVNALLAALFAYVILLVVGQAIE